MSRADAVAHLEQLATTLPEPDRAPQLVHGDVRSANVLVHDRRVTGLLDLDEIGLDHRVADVARGAVLLATRFPDWAPTPPLARSTFIDGYRDAVDLTDTELAWLDALLICLSVAMIPPGPDPAGGRPPSTCSGGQNSGETRERAKQR